MTKGKTTACLALLAFAGCAAPWLPPDPPTSPASPNAREGRRAPRSSALRADSTDRAIVARLRDGGNASSHSPMEMERGATPAASYYTCVMHPEIHQDQPGQCPKCGMTLVKKEGAR